jgi:uncharacterized Tic20 family protein
MAQMNEVPETPQNPYVNANEPQGGGAVPPGGPPGEVAKEMNRDARMWAMLCHLAGFAFLLPVLPIIGSVIGPLIIWILKKEQFPFVDEQGKEAVNFQITMLIYGLVAGLSIFICIGAVLLPAVAIVDIVLIIIAAIKANDGNHYRYPYPLIIRFIK